MAQTKYAAPTQQLESQLQESLSSLCTPQAQAGCFMIHKISGTFQSWLPYLHVIIEAMTICSNHMVHDCLQGEDCCAPFSSSWSYSLTRLAVWSCNISSTGRILRTVMGIYLCPRCFHICCKREQNTQSVNHDAVPFLSELAWLHIDSWPLSVATSVWQTYM